MVKLNNRKKLSPAERQKVYEKTNGHCAYCGVEIKFQQMQVDHIVPFAVIEYHNVNSEYVDTIENMLPACRSCNYYKSTLTVEKFREALMRMPDVLLRDSVTYKNAVRFGLVTPTPHMVRFYFEKLGLDIH